MISCDWKDGRSISHFPKVNWNVVFFNLLFNQTINKTWRKQKGNYSSFRCLSARKLTLVFNFPNLLCGFFHRKTTFIFLNAFCFSSKEVTYSRKQRESWDSVIKWLNFHHFKTHFFFTFLASAHFLYVHIVHNITGHHTLVQKSPEAKYPESKGDPSDQTVSLCSRTFTSLN